MAPPDWWPEVLTARVPEVTMALSEGLGGPEDWEEDPPWPWLVPLC